jgi:aminoglycoside N3'-acetyltransferase
MKHEKFWVLKMDTNEISKERIIKDLKKIGVKKGDHLNVALSFKSLGRVKGGPDVFIDALIESVGPNGTIMMNTHTKQFYLSTIKSNKISYIYDPGSTSATTGIIPETFRKRKDAIRSCHPVNSVTAIGKYAKYLTKDHDENSPAYSPYLKLAKVNGKVLCIGIGDNMVAIRHEAQYLAGLLTVVPFRYGVKFKDKNKEIKLFVRKDVGGCIKKLPRFVSHLREMGIVKDGKIGMANAIIAPAKETIEVMTDMLKKDPVLNLCDDISCLWCRELERRLDLYEKIENPKSFQIYPPIIMLIALLNWFRLRHFKFAGIVICGMGKIL